MIDRPAAGETDPAWYFIGSSDRGDEGDNEAQRRLIAFFAMTAEINNGGFDQWFFNPSGHLAPDALALALEIGHSQLSVLLQESIDRFDRPFPIDQSTRREQLAAFDEAWDLALCERFYEIEESESFDALMNSYVANRPQLFFRGALGEG